MMRRYGAAAVVVALLLSGCGSADVSIRSAEVSDDDTRLGLALNSCNADLRVGVAEQDDQVVILASDEQAPLIRLSGNDCLDGYVVQLSDPLGDREVVDGTDGSIVSVMRVPPEGKVPWPYDRDRVTEAEYLAALDDMVACLSTTDPELDAWVYQGLDWKTYRWHKEPDEQGNLSRPPALDICHEEHLKSLEPPTSSPWTDEDVMNAMGNWVNQLGLARDDPDVWSDRLHEICAVWNTTEDTTVELGDLALRYIEEDAEVSIRADGTLPHVEEGATALLQIADSPTCGVVPDPNATGAWDPTATMAPDEIVADPSVAEPGTLVAVLFPDGRMRGIHYVLESIGSDGVVTLSHHLISDWGGDKEPHSFPADRSDDFAVEDIGINSPGPDMVLIPAEASPGEYRICTGNSRHNICTPLTIIPAGSDAMADLLHHSLTIDDGLPTGEFIGEISIVDSCVTLLDGVDRYLTIWPEGYRFEDNSVLDDRGNVVAVDGEEVHFGGGESTGGVAGPFPDCGQTSFWMVTEVLLP
ncbi:MAG: hypothetical protein ABFR89_09775 [Actinomycetota bacterium]